MSQDAVETDVCLRPAHVALDPADLGGARATRHSFARTMLRRAASHGWRVRLERAHLDALGRGVVVYEVAAEGHRWSFVAYCQTLTEAERTDRVIAQAWDVTAALVEGPVGEDTIARLRPEVTRQEAGRAAAGTLIWTRANRSGRFFDQVVDRLAAGRQPERDGFRLSPYLLRSTAFYSNGKFGLADFESFEEDHPLAVPYRAHMLAAWLLRDLSYELVEHCAAARSDGAVKLTGEWRRYFGLGNATGLGMVPYVVNHPEVLDAWMRLRERPLAHVTARAVDPRDEDVARVRGLVERAIRYLGEQQEDDPAPYTPGATLARRLGPVHELVVELAEHGTMAGVPEVHAWCRLHDAAGDDPEVRGVVAAVLTELSATLDDELESALRCTERRVVDPRMRCDALRELLERRYSWVLAFDFSDTSQCERFWFSSTDNEEPRRAVRGSDPGEPVEHPVDVARSVQALRADLDDEMLAGTTVGEFLLGRPRHRGTVARVQTVGRLEYGELHDNLLGRDFLPLHVQRFQLATYGMDNFSPQSTDWLRVTLYSGAPRIADLAAGSADDGWLFTPRPTATERNEP